MKKLRIVTVGISGGRSLTGPLGDARRFPYTRWYLVPRATRTTLGLGFIHHSRAVFCRAVPNPKRFSSLYGEGAQHHDAGLRRGEVQRRRQGSCGSQDRGAAVEDPHAPRRGQIVAFLELIERV
jgi:hypothetical protein